MRKIGSAYGISFCFQEYSICGFEILRQGKEPDALINETHSSPIISFSKTTEEFSSKDRGSFEQQISLAESHLPIMSSTQTFAEGNRKIEIRQIKPINNKKNKRSKFANDLRSVADLIYELTRKISWSVVLRNIHEIIASGERTVKIAFGNKIIIEIYCSQKLDIQREENNILKVSTELNEGRSAIRMVVTSSPVLKFSDTIVVCRPDQLREAAIIISCVKTKKFIPLIVLNDPPITIEEYKNVLKEFSLIDKKFRESGATTPLGFRSFSDDPEIKEIEIKDLTFQRSVLQSALGPFRSWLKNNEMLGNIILDSQFSEAIFLCDAGDGNYPTNILFYHSTGDNDNSGSFLGDLSLFPKEIKKICFYPVEENKYLSADDQEILYYKDLGDLTSIAWKRLGPSKELPVKTIDVGSGNMADLFISVFRSLNDDRPIKIIEPTSDKNSNKDHSTENNIALSGSKEAVIVEAFEDASQLIGVIYARYRNANLIITPRPDLTKVRKQIALCQEKVSGVSGNLRYLAEHHKDPGATKHLTNEQMVQLQRMFVNEREDPSTFDQVKFLSAVKNFFFDNWQTNALNSIEHAVTEQVPDHVIDNVGDRHLTAFTCGLPYNFVNNAKVSWKNKPIGHVIKDNSLLILREIFEDGSTRPDIEFNLVCDPGFFKKETQQVLRSLKDTTAHTFLLSGSAATSTAVVNLSKGLPLEIIFFNTHGSDSEILFWDRALPHDRIPQWFTLSTHPIVFNNSCISWTGVGSEFIRVGARGYIGTLWSVEAVDAANFARLVMDRISIENLAVSAAICDTGVKEINSRAYIFVGTANTVSAKSGLNFTQFKREYLTAAAEILLDLVPLDEKTVINTLEFYETILEEANQFIAALKEISGPHDPDLMRLRSKQLELIYMASKLKGTVSKRYGSAFAQKVALEYIEILELKTQKDGPEMDMLEKFYQFSGKFFMLSHEFQQAESATLKSLDLAKKGSGELNAQYILLCEIYKLSGQTEKGIAIGKTARSYFEEQDDAPNKMLILGQLSQLYKRIGDLGSSLRTATEGHDEFVKLQVVPEQVAFLMDIANANIHLGRPDDAITAANNALTIAQGEMSPLLVLAVNGVLTQCYIAKKNYEQARQYALTGIEQSKILQNAKENLIFLIDLAQIEILEKNFKKGIDAYFQASVLSALQNELSGVQHIFTRIIDASIGSADEKIIFYSINSQIEFYFQLVEEFRAKFLLVTINNILRVSKEIAEKKYLELIGLLVDQIDVLVKTKADITWDVHFMKLFLVIIRDLFTSQFEEAMILAKDLDERSNNIASLLEFCNYYVQQKDQ